MEPSETVERVAREKADRLDQFSRDVMACRVVHDQQPKHQHQGRPFGVRLHVSLPGHELTVDRVEHEDVYVALRDAFDDTTRRIEDAVRRNRGQEKLHAVPLHVEVVRLDDEGACGFIRTPDGDEYYFS